MNSEDKIFLDKINKYAEEVLADIDPTKTQVSFQLEKLRPIMQQLAMEYQMSVEDVFIKYMDLASEDRIQKENEFKAKYGENDTMDLNLNQF